MADLFSDSIPTVPGEYWIRSKVDGKLDLYPFNGNEESHWSEYFLIYWSIGPKVLSPEETDRANWVMANLQYLQVDNWNNEYSCSLGAFGDDRVGYGNTVEAAIDAYRNLPESQISQVPPIPPVPQSDRESFLAHLEQASATVATWPEWKQNVLRDSDKPEVSTPRTPIVPGEEVKPADVASQSKENCDHVNMNKEMSMCFDCGQVWRERFSI